MNEHIDISIDNLKDEKLKEILSKIIITLDDGTECKPNLVSINDDEIILGTNGEQTQLDTMEAKKQSFIKAFKKSYGNIAKSCKAVSIVRQTYYNWLKNDPAFKAEIEGIQPEEDFLDFLENKAVERINEGSDSVLIFALKAKGKKRGWIEKQIIETETPQQDQIDYNLLTDDELRELIKLQRKLKSKESGSSSSDS